MAGVSLNWGGLDRVVERAGKRLAAQRRNLLNAVGETLVSGTLERFENEEDPEGKKWEPSGRGGKTLQKTGELRSSIDYAVTQDGVLVGSNKKYARIHQEGGTIRPKKGKYLKFKGRDGKDVFVKEVTIPARPYLGISKADREEVEAVIADYMEDCFKE